MGAVRNLSDDLASVEIGQENQPTWGGCRIQTRLFFSRSVSRQFVGEQTFDRSEQLANPATVGFANRTGTNAVAKNLLRIIGRMRLKGGGSECAVCAVKPFGLVHFILSSLSFPVAVFRMSVSDFQSAIRLDFSQYQRLAPYDVVAQIDPRPDDHIAALPCGFGVHHSESSGPFKVFSCNLKLMPRCDSIR